MVPNSQINVAQKLLHTSKPIWFCVTTLIHMKCARPDQNQNPSRLLQDQDSSTWDDDDTATSRLLRGSSISPPVFQPVEPNVLRWTPSSLARSIKAPAERHTHGYQPQSHVASAIVSLVLLTQVTRRWSLPGSLCLTWHWHAPSYAQRWPTTTVTCWYTRTASLFALKWRVESMVSR